MKRTYNPEVAPLRKKEYQKLDDKLLEALAETMEGLKEQGVTLAPAMEAVLTERQLIKQTFKKQGE